MRNKTKSKKKIKEIRLPVEFNPGLSKYEPKLPLRKGPAIVERKVNKWAFWYIIIEFLLFLLPGLCGLYLLVKYFMR